MISLLVPFRDDGEHRARVWNWLRRYWQATLPGAEIIEGCYERVPFCADSDTKILTADGWKSHADVKVGDLALTLNHETGMSEWQPVDAVNVFDVIDEQMLHIESWTHSSMTTMNHRWPVVRRGGKGIRKRPDYTDATLTPEQRDQLIIQLHSSGMSFGAIGRQMGLTASGVSQRVKRIGRGGKPRHQRGGRGWTTTKELNAQDRVPIAAMCADLPTEPKYTDAFVEAVAWFWTEGDNPAAKRRGSVRITQSHIRYPENCERIRAALTTTFGAPSQRLDGSGTQWREGVDGENIRFYLGRRIADALTDVAPGRVPTFDFLRSLTRAQLDLFIDVSILADGTDSTCGRSLAQKDPKAAEAFQFTCILAGHGTSIRPNRMPDIKRAKYGYDMTNVHIRKSRSVALMGTGTAQIESYTGLVWCPTTASGTWLARRNGTVYFTGNSKARAVNEAASRATGSVYAILDADAYLPAATIQTCADIIERERRWFVPYQHLYRLGEAHTLRLLATDPSAPIPLPPTADQLDTGPRNQSDGAHKHGAMCQVMSREAFETVGGFDPRFDKGWGSEDTSFLRSLDTLWAQHETMPGHIAHLWHARIGENDGGKTRAWKGQQKLGANKALGRRYRNANGYPSAMRRLIAER